MTEAPLAWLKALIFFMYFLMVQSIPDDLELVQITVISRHGVRSPYPPPNGTLYDFSSYTDKIFPNNDSWGMTHDAFVDQELTPHGKTLIPIIARWFALAFSKDELNIACDKIATYADDSFRDVQTATLWLKGFGCEFVPVVTANTSQPDLQPALSDHFDSGCSVATENQIRGLYGGDVNSLVDSYSLLIDTVMEVLDMHQNAPICKNVNPSFNATQKNCTLYETGYKWTGHYWQGMFLSPLFYAQYFAEAWLLQYLSNLESWAFNMLSIEKLVELYQMHIKVLSFGSNYWTSRAYGSHQLAYILNGMEQMIKKSQLDGIVQKPDTQLILLFCHDTNLRYLQQLLDLSWTTEGWNFNVASTGSALTFELWYSPKEKSYYVKTKYTTASPMQQRNAEKLTLNNPPGGGSAEIIIPKCDQIFCPYKKFKEIVLYDAVDLDCIVGSLSKTTNALITEDIKKNTNFYEIGFYIMSTFFLMAVCAVAIMARKNCSTKNESFNGYSSLQT